MVIPKQKNSSNQNEVDEIKAKKRSLFQDVEQKLVNEIKEMNLEDLLTYQKSLTLTIDRMEGELMRLKNSRLPLLIREHWDDLNALIEEMENYLEASEGLSSSKSSLKEG
jgi:hypothetical protein